MKVETWFLITFHPEKWTVHSEAYEVEPGAEEYAEKFLTNRVLYHFQWTIGHFVGPASNAPAFCARAIEDAGLPLARILAREAAA